MPSLIRQLLSHSKMPLAEMANRMWKAVGTPQSQQLRHQYLVSYPQGYTQPLPKLPSSASNIVAITTTTKTTIKTYPPVRKEPVIRTLPIDNRSHSRNSSPALSETSVQNISDEETSRPSTPISEQKHSDKQPFLSVPEAAAQIRELAKKRGISEQHYQREHAAVISRLPHAAQMAFNNARTAIRARENIR